MQLLKTCLILETPLVGRRKPNLLHHSLPSTQPSSAHSVLAPMCRHNKQANNLLLKRKKVKNFNVLLMVLECSYKKDAIYLTNLLLNLKNRMRK